MCSLLSFVEYDVIKAFIYIVVSFVEYDVIKVFICSVLSLVEYDVINVFICSVLSLVLYDVIKVFICSVLSLVEYDGVAGDTLEDLADYFDSLADDGLLPEDYDCTLAVRFSAWPVFGWL